MACSPRSNVILLVGTLLVANINVVLGTQATGFRDETAQQDSKQAPFNETGIVLESITLQSGNTYNSHPNSTNVYGSISQQTNQVNSSSSDHHGSYPTVIVSDSNGEGVSYSNLESYQPQKYHGHSNPLFNMLGALTVRGGKTYNSASNSKNFYGSIAQQHNRIYSFPGHHGPSSPKSRTVVASETPGQGLSQSSLSYYQPLQYHEKLSQFFNTQGSATIQTGNTYKSGPGSKNFYGSNTQQTGQVYSSDIPGQATPCVNLGSFTVQKGNTYNSAPNSQNVYGSITLQTNQVYIDHHGSSNGTRQGTPCRNFGSVTIQEGNTYL